MRLLKRYLSVLLLVCLPYFMTGLGARAVSNNETPWWPIQAIDTMKYSRDEARQRMGDKTFEATIEKQVQQIADTGANYISIGTPYDEEFIPYMKRWVGAARRRDLHVWFRGNFSGWEGWFGYKRIDRETEIAMTKALIAAHPDLFEEGDIFSPCPECENGGPGNPFETGDIEGHRQFLIELYRVSREAFQRIGKNVATNFHSMNGDLAERIMDEETTKALGGVITVDHYVRSPEKLVGDVVGFGQKAKGKVMLGEFGAPIPDIHGEMSEAEQAQWIDETLTRLEEENGIWGLNYWVGYGGSTKLWNDDGTARAAVAVITKHFKPKVYKGEVDDEYHRPVKGARVTTATHATLTGEDGSFAIPYIAREKEVEIKMNGFVARKVAIGTEEEKGTVVIQSEETGIRRWVHMIMAKIWAIFK